MTSVAALTSRPGASYFYDCFANLSAHKVALPFSGVGQVTVPLRNAALARGALKLGASLRLYPLPLALPLQLSGPLLGRRHPGKTASDLRQLSMHKPG